MIDYKKIKAGDTLQVVGTHIIDGEYRLEPGAKVTAREVHRAGVTVEDENGDEHMLAFEHGAEKLEYTDETKKAIKARAELAAKKAAEAKKKAKGQADAEAEEEAGEPGGE